MGKRGRRFISFTLKLVVGFKEPSMNLLFWLFILQRTGERLSVKKETPASPKILENLWILALKLFPIVVIAIP